ncbi:mitochondrial carrier domain-containing protein [Umbelopsis sp. PMI_123]|nr:mitochondrial carrier domain-containing protein [Umbelopsis sp. PMI_123]
MTDVAALPAIPDNEIETVNSANQAIKDCVSGTFGGILQVLVGQPFDTVKVRLQTQSRTNPLYSGMLDCVRKTRAREGYAGFYKGTTTPLVGIGACVSIQFVVLEYMKRTMSQGNQNVALSNAQLCVAGGVAGIANSVVSGPVEHIRTRLQVQTGTGTGYSGPIDAISKIYRSYGIRGIYKGQMMTVLREGVGYSAYFACYEYLVQQTMDSQNLTRKQIPTTQVCLYGALSGYAMWGMMYPLDIIKSKLQTDSLDVSKRQYRSAIDCARQVLATEGVKGFFRGFGPCMLRAAPVNAVTFLGFETAMRVLS